MMGRKVVSVLFQMLDNQGANYMPQKVRVILFALHFRHLTRNTLIDDDEGILGFHGEDEVVKVAKVFSFLRI